MKLKDKVAIITGSSKGIGLGVAKEFVKEGAKVVISCRNAAEGLKVAEDLGMEEKKSIFIRTDVKEVNDIKNLINKTVEAFGRIDILVNNAGWHNGKSIENTSLEEWEHIIDTNLRSNFMCTKFAIPYLRKTKGNIVNMSSVTALNGQRNATAYVATKGGIIAMTKNLALDLAPEIRVNVICPGWIDTPLLRGWVSNESEREFATKIHPVKRLGTAYDVARAAVFLASNEESSFLTGIAMTVDGGVTLGYPAKYE